MTSPQQTSYSPVKSENFPFEIRNKIGIPAIAVPVNIVLVVLVSAAGKEKERHQNGKGGDKCH